MSLRILMLSPSAAVPGPIPKHTPLLVDGLRELGCTVVSDRWGRAAEGETPGAKAARLLRDVVRVRRLLAADIYDVIVLKTSHEWVSLLRDLPLLMATRGATAATVIQFHGGHSDRLAAPGNLAFKGVSRLVFGLVDGVLLLSSEESRKAAGFYPAGRFRTVSNPFQPAAPPMVEPAAEEERPVSTLLFAGRLIKEKGIFDVLEALALLRRDRECRLIVAGSGPAATEVADRVAELGLADHVELAGQLKSSEMSLAYRSADLFVLPTYWGEGFPTVISEAMDAGLPIVATRTRGIADHLRDGVNVAFVAPRSPARLASTLRTVLADSELRLRMAAANREHVKSFAPVPVAAQYLSVLGELVDSTGHRG